MTRYWIFGTVEEAEAVNDRVTAERKPVWRAQGDEITQRAMGMIVHPEGVAVVLCGDERHSPHMSGETEVSRDELEADGWFPETE